MTELTTDIEILRDWIGREQTLTDTIDPVAVRRLELTLDRAPTLTSGDPLPPVWHPLAFIEVAAHSGLGPDGHPARGGFLPPVALPRRMWAGSRLRYHAPLPIGATATRSSTIDDVVVKRSVWTDAADRWYPGGPEDPDVVLVELRTTRIEL